MTLIGAGPADPALVDLARGFAPVLAAADGGAATLAEMALPPAAVIGDMDSIAPRLKAALPADVLHQIDEQDSTDFEKCLTRIAAPLVLAVGFAGGRIDHELAVLNTLVRHPARRCVVLGARDAICLLPPRLTLDCEAGTRVSLFPLGCVRGRSAGLRWPIDGIDFAPGGRIGTSNRATGPATLSVEAPAMLLILPLRMLPALVAGLAEAPRWPEEAEATAPAGPGREARRRDV